MSKMILASTLGMELSELSDYEYQSYTSPKVYAVGDSYFACHKSTPRHEVGGGWTKHKDQFFAAQKGTTIWVAEAVHSVY